MAGAATTDSSTEVTREPCMFEIACYGLSFDSTQKTVSSQRTLPRWGLGTVSRQRTTSRESGQLRAFWPRVQLWMLQGLQTVQV